MMSFHSILNVICDSGIVSEFCWGEIPLYLVDGETKDFGIETLEKWGWDFSNPDHQVCPYCNKGLKIEDVLPPSRGSIC